MMNCYADFLRGRRTGAFARCKYPNLVEVYGYFPTSYFANVTNELMHEVFKGNEDLTFEEMSNIAKYNGIPLSVLTCSKLITLSRKRWRHWQMMKVLEKKLYEIWDLQKQGSKYADGYMREYVNTGRGDYVNMDLDFRNGRVVTYGHYLGVKHKMDDIILFAHGEFSPKPRGLKTI